MENDEIIAVQEDFDKIYRDFSRDLGEYLRVMQDNVGKITDAVGALSQAWVADSFKSFERHAMDGMEDITDGLATCKKLKEQMDAFEQELSENIRLMKSGYKH